MRVGAHEQLAGPGEALQVHVVGDAVSGRRVAHAVAAAERAQVLVLGHVALVDLQHVVVDVEYGERYRGPVDVERLELHGAHRAGGVLDEDLVDVDDKIGAGFERPSPAMRGEEDVREVLGHLPMLSPEDSAGPESPCRDYGLTPPMVGYPGIPAPAMVPNVDDTLSLPGTPGAI